MTMIASRIANSIAPFGVRRKLRKSHVGARASGTGDYASRGKTFPGRDVFGQKHNTSELTLGRPSVTKVDLFVFKQKDLRLAS